MSAYLKLCAGATDTGYSFLLESVHGGEQPARYSFLGANPAARAARGAARRRPAGRPARSRAPGAGWSRAGAGALPPFLGGAVGYLGYEAACSFEPVPRAPHDPHGLPLALFGVYDTIVAMDHAYGLMQVISLAPLDDDPAAAYDAALARIEERRRPARRPAAGAATRAGGRPGSPRPPTAGPASTRPWWRAPRNTSSPATLSRWCSRSASPARRARRPSPSTAPCAR